MLSARRPCHATAMPSLPCRTATSLLLLAIAVVACESKSAGTGGTGASSTLP
jgi:hypothetical protein